MDPTNQNANRSSAASNNTNSMYFNGPQGYVGDQNIDFDKAGILYETKDQYWLIYERVQHPDNPVVRTWKPS
jgi:hypothetical protein